jgi:hypothetical protein
MEKRGPATKLQTKEEQSPATNSRTLSQQSWTKPRSQAS